MMPVMPSLLIRPLQGDERNLIADALNAALADMPFTRPFNTAELYEQLYSPNPPSLHSVRWQQCQRIAAWRARRLEGFIDVATGFDSESQERPEYNPVGLLRFFLLLDQSERTDTVAAALLEAAEQFWQTHRVGYVKAFHHSTGYPNFQAGLGAVPGDWSTEVRALTSAGYHFTDRFYCLTRPLATLVEETMPLAQLSVVYTGSAADRIYQLYRRSEWVGMARVVTIHLEGAIGGHRLAKLVHMEIDPTWRGQNIGKWLLRRVINDSTIQGCSQLVAHVSHLQSVALSLMTQLGFMEEDYRGYSLEKALTA